MSRTLRTSFTLATIALALSACTSSGEQTASEVPVSEAPVTTEAVPTTEAPATTEGPVETEAPVTTEAPAVASGGEDETVQPVALAEPTVCDADQHSPGGVFVVTGIDADDPDGGLVARAFAGTESPVRGVIPQDITVDTFAEDSDYPTCFVTADGGVWWEIGHPILAAGGWVNASYLESAG